MEKQRIIAIKAALKTFLSIMLVFVLAMGVAFLPLGKVSAAGRIITAPGERRVSWADGEDSIKLELNVSAAGLYEINIGDYVGTGTVEISVFDEDNEVYALYEECEVGGDYVTKPFFLSPYNEYSVNIYYYSETDGYIGGDLKIKFARNYDSLPEISASSIASGGITTFLIDAYGTYWFQYTPNINDDYTFSYTGDLCAGITLYDKQTGDAITQETFYYDYSQQAGVFRNKVIFNLTTGQTHYFVINNYDEEISCKFAASKNNGMIEEIGINSFETKMDSWSEITPETFDYEVSYKNSNNESKIMSYAEMCSAGFYPVTVEYNMDLYTINGEALQGAGKRTLTLNYLGEESKYAIDIQSITDWLIEDGKNFAENGDKWQNNQSDENEIWYSRIKVNKTGAYDFRTEHWDNVEAYSFEILDSRNNPLEYNDAAGGWPLIAGEEYALSYIFEFKQNAASQFDFALNLENENLFSDADLSAWYGKAITYAVGRGIIKGYENGNFGTADGIQRQDFLVMLARLEGVEPEWYDPGDSGFSDVRAGSYYDWAVAWGKQTGIVTGYEDGRFGVGDYITREQIVTFLCRYAAYKGLAIEIGVDDYIRIISTYSDYSNISDFAAVPIMWAVKNGVINGKTANTIVPQGNAQRCEVAQIMYNIFKNEVF